MKKTYKKVILIIIVLILLFSINTKVFAIGEIFDDGKSFLDAASSDKVDIDIADIQETSGYLYNILLSAGIVIAVIVATVLGIQFMLSEAEGQAKVKEMLIPFIIGCVIVFGGFGIWKIALDLGKNVDEQLETSQSSADEGHVSGAGRK